MLKNYKYLLTRYFEKELSLKVILLIVFLSATARVAIELILLDYSGYVIELGYFENYARFYLENVYYFIILFLLLSVFVSSSIKEPIKKVMDFGVRLYPIIIIPPILDRLIWGRTEGYIYGKIDHFFTNFLTLSWASGDTSYGISFLVTLGVLSVSFYVFYKKRSIFTSLFVFVGTSFIIMLLSTPDLFFGQDGGDYGHDYFLPAYYIFPLLFLSSLLYYTHSKEKIKALFGNMRPIRSLMFVGTALLGYLTIPNPTEGLVAFTVRPYYPLFAAMIVLLLWWFSIIVNDIHDYNIDKISNKKRPLPQQKLSREEYLFIGMFLAFLALSLGAAINLTVFIATVLFFVLGFVYSAPPFRLRKSFLGNIVIGIALVLSFIIGVFTMWSWDVSVLFATKNIIFMLLIMLFGTFVTLSKDLKDMGADQQFGISNLYTRLGKKRGKKAVTILLLFILNTPILLIKDISILFVTLFTSLVVSYLYYTKESVPIVYAGSGFIMLYAFIILYYV